MANMSKISVEKYEASTRMIEGLAGLSEKASAAAIPLLVAAFLAFMLWTFWRSDRPPLPIRPFQLLEGWVVAWRTSGRQRLFVS